MYKINLSKLILLTLIVCAIITCQKLEIVSITKVESGSASSVGMNTASLTSTFIDVGDITEYGHCWNTSSNPTIENELSKSIGKPKIGAFKTDLSNLAPNTTYFARPFAKENGRVIYGDEISFKTLEVPISITNPTNSSDWIIGNQYTITWIDEITANVKIELYKGADFHSTISSNYASTGSFNWTIPSSITPDNNYKIVITSKDNSSIQAESEIFAISEPETITINLPNAETVWTKGENQNITWVDNISENVKIELYKGGTYQFDIETNTESDGISAWSIPTDIIADIDYNIKITSVENSEVYSESGYFKIANQTGSINDIEGNTYTTVLIGNQWWMAENLKVTKYADGTAIPLIQDNTEWGNLSDNNTDKAYCFYNNNASGEKDNFGALYSWPAASGGLSSIENPSTVQGVCPFGWHLPSDEEWKELEMYLGMSQSDADAEHWRGTIEGDKLRSIGSTFWGNSNTNATNASDFSALPGERRSDIDGSFNTETKANFWTSTSFDYGSAMFRALALSGQIDRSNFTKSLGYSIRCVKGEAKQIGITIPAYQDHWVAGGIWTIGWIDFIPENVNIDLYDDGTFIQSVVSNVPSNGTYEWTIPSSLTASTTYTVRVSSSTNSNIYADSEQFQISEATGTTGTITDYDGNTYKTVKIEKQWWMAENIKTMHYNDGTAIPDGANEGDLTNDESSKFYFAPNNDETNVAIYGRLYTWNAVTNSTTATTNPSEVQGVCPTGWHVPNDAEWQQLENYIGMPDDELDIYADRGTVEGGRLKEVGTTHWVIPNTSATDDYGFTALPAGQRTSQGTFPGLGYTAFFWNSSYGYYRILVNDAGYIGRYGHNLSTAMSVRCVKD